MPPKNKSKNAPNQHDKRHESGLAPPGKRVTKNHSNGQLNGQPNGKVASATTPPATSSTGLNAYKFPRSLDSAEAAQQTFAKDYAVPPESTERDRTGSEASLDEGGQCADMDDYQLEHDPTAPSVEAQLPAYRVNTPAHTVSTLSNISTILAYYPLRDAIAILILLLSLPSTLVLVIQTLFASLTFVPPTASLSLSTLPNVKEMFNSPNLGYPALATILIVDCIFFFCWLPVWKPMQGMFLDFSQAVIAVSLSGAAASSGGPTYSIATTTIIVCIVHVLRYKAIHLTALDYLRSVIHKADVGIQLDVPFLTNFSFLPPIERGWLETCIRTLLGIHIVSQGVTTCIRRSLVKANEQSANTPPISKTDAEAAVESEPTMRPTIGLAESVQHAATGQSTDSRPPGPSPARDSRARESSTKKKRKQANQVRSQQPLWAAIASTKVTFAKEMEQREAAEDAREAARMDTNTASTITSDTNTTTTNRIWICEVRDTEIFLSVELSAAAAMDNTENLEDDTGTRLGIDKSKPFYVRINGATWSSARIIASANEDDSNTPASSRYEGEIFGLAPLSTYNCEIVAIGSQDVLSSVSIITQPAPTAEQAVSATSQPTHQALRPSSPITTLKQSIQSAEARLNEIRNRSKKTKKDQRAAHADIKREINALKAKLDASGGSDDKQEKRLAQINQHKSQAEEATAELKEQIEVLGELPEAQVARSEALRSRWQTASNAMRAAEKGLENLKAEGERESSATKSEICQMESKRDKLAARLAQRHQEMERLLSRQQADMTAKQKRDFDQAQKFGRREQEEHEIRSHVASLEAEIQAFERKTQDTYQQIVALQSWSAAAPSPYPGYSSPPTPENAFPGLNGALVSPLANGFPPMALQPFQSPFHSAQPSISNTQSAPRGRSSSMLSQYSGFTEPGDDHFFSPEQPRAQYPWPVQPSAGAGAAMVEDQKQSSSSGSQQSGSTGSNSPRPDAKPFFPGKASAVGTIGPPSKAPHSPFASPGAVGRGR